MAGENMVTASTSGSPASLSEIPQLNSVCPCRATA